MVSSEVSGTALAYLSESLHSVADIDARRRLRSADTSTATSDLLL